MRKFLAHAPRGGRWLPRALASVLLLAVVLSSSGDVLAGSSSREEQESRTVTIDGETKIYVKNARGKTIIVGRKDAVDVTVRAVKYVRAGDSQTATEWMDELNVTVDTDGEGISVISSHPKWARETGGFWTFLKRIKHKAYIDYTIEVPSRFDAKVASTSGDVQITSLNGSVKLFGSSGDVFLKDIGGGTFIELSSGDVRIKGIGGDLYVRMSSGDANVRDVGGLLRVQATSGDMEVTGVGGDASVELSSGSLVLKGCGGNVVVKTQSGDGEISGVEGSIQAVATSGDLYVTLNSVGPKDNVFKSSSGDVEVVFHTPEGYGFVLEVSTNSGSIEGDLDIALDKISRNLLRGVVGTGDGRVYIETASGDIRIKQTAKQAETK